MMPGVVAGFPLKPEAPTSVTLAGNDAAFWNAASPTPQATKAAGLVSLSGRFNGTNVSGSGSQQLITTLPAGYRPVTDLSGNYATWYTTAGVGQGPIAIRILNNGVVALDAFAPSANGYIVFNPSLTFLAA